mgnify:CR=1 FL=1|tara:strand:+ start:43 stop:732 length:690 start_codon:yes stop_codon:yes gene_type:complete
MFNNSKIICVIPARKGSTRLRNKNIKKFCGKPLVYWSIIISKLSKYVDKTYVTSDDPKILKLAQELECETVNRNAKLSNNTIMSDFAVLDVLKKFGKLYDIVIYLQPTSPLRKLDDIDLALEEFSKSKSDSLLSVVKNKKFIWHKKNKSNFYDPVNYDIKKRPMSQNFFQYEENGSIYITKVKQFINSKNRLVGKISIFQMSDWQSYDIDNLDDFKKCEEVFNEKIKGY